MDRKRSRRSFLKGMVGGLGTALTTRLTWLFPESQQSLEHRVGRTATQVSRTTEQVTGTLHEGFLLLPEIDVPVPDFVQRVTPPAPHNARTLDLVGETLEFDTVEDLRKYISFPTYIPTSLSPGVQLTEASVLQFAESGDIYYAITSFGESNAGSPSTSILAQPTYSHPYPIWPVRSPTGQNIVLPEKVIFTPAPGILLPSAVGFLLLWIEGEILYRLFVEDYSTRETPIEVVESLVQI